MQAEQMKDDDKHRNWTRVQRKWMEWYAGVSDGQEEGHIKQDEG